MDNRWWSITGLGGTGTERVYGRDCCFRHCWRIGSDVRSFVQATVSLHSSLSFVVRPSLLLLPSFVVADTVLVVGVGVVVVVGGGVDVGVGVVVVGGGGGGGGGGVDSLCSSLPPPSSLLLFV